MQSGNSPEHPHDHAIVLPVQLDTSWNGRVTRTLEVADAGQPPLRKEVPMGPQPLQLLERSLEPVVAEFIGLAFVFITATSIALVILAAVMLAVNLVAAWRDAPRGRATTGLQTARRTNTPSIAVARGSASHPILRKL